MSGDETWYRCTEGMPSGKPDNWVLAWNAEWPRPRLVNWCAQGVSHWRNEQDDRAHFVNEPTHWKYVNPPVTP